MKKSRWCDHCVAGRAMKSRPVLVRGQYAKGAIHGDPVLGYRQEENVNPDSQRILSSPCVCSSTIGDGRTFQFICASETASKVGNRNFHSFQKAPAVLFNKDLHDLNVLVIRIQPDEESRYGFMPGAWHELHIEPVKMDFHYGTSFGKASPEAYERLLLDAMSGDASSLPAATRSSKPGLSSIRSSKLGTRKRCARIVLLSRRLMGTGSSRRLLAARAAWRRL